MTAAIETSAALGAAAVAAGFLSALYAARLHLLAFGSGEPPPRIRRPTSMELLATGTLALTSVALGVLWIPGVPAILETLTGGDIPAGSPWEFVLAVAMVGAGLLAVLLLERRGRLLDLGLAPSLRAGVADWLTLPRLTSTLVVAPTLRLSFALARADDRVIDAGVRASARTARLVSSLVDRRVEFSIDGVVRTVATATLRTADMSGVADDAGVDRAIEATGQGIGVAGHQIRRLQTGQTHHYFVIVAAGLGLIAVILAVAR